jgi:DNA sulfur modification protein DndB
MMRPVVQKAIVRALHTIVDQEILTWAEALERLAKLSWQISDAPWTAVFNVANGKMITAKENADLLEDLVCAHIAPTTKSEISRARKTFKEVRQKQYPVSQGELEKAIVQVGD